MVAYRHMLQRLQRVAVCTVVLGLMVVPTIGFSHAIIPHGHVHASDSALHVALAHGLESILLRHDIAIPLLCIAVLWALLHPVRNQLGAGAQVDTFVYTHALRRGIFPYRRFG